MLHPQMMIFQWLQVILLIIFTDTKPTNFLEELAMIRAKKSAGEKIVGAEGVYVRPTADG
jgi:hypothetical protein